MGILCIARKPIFSHFELEYCWGNLRRACSLPRGVLLSQGGIAGCVLRIVGHIGHRFDLLGGAPVYVNRVVVHIFFCVVGTNWWRNICNKMEHSTSNSVNLVIHNANGESKLL